MLDFLSNISYKYWILQNGPRSAPYLLVLINMERQTQAAGESWKQNDNVQEGADSAQQRWLGVWWCPARELDLNLEELPGTITTGAAVWWDRYLRRQRLFRLPM